MILLAQGWKGGRVVALVLSPASNDTSGYDLHVGTYDPSSGQSINNAAWRFLSSMFDIVALIRMSALPEMLTWDGPAPTDLRSLIERLDQHVDAIGKGLNRGP